MKLAGDVAILRLDNGKANAIDRALLDKLERFLEDAGSVGARALVLTGYDRYFSTGLALPSLIALERDEMARFMARFADVMLKLYASSLPVVAAVNGHAIAGGCVLALMADLRLMADDGFTIGLNEIQLGVGLPPCVIEPLRAAVPPACARAIALGGGLFSPEEALALHLVDQLAPRAELESSAVKQAQAMADLPDLAFAQVKAAIRRPVLEACARLATDETERWLDTWFSDAARHRIIPIVGKLTPKG